ncbi:MAG: class I SAM-dependent methyltransferase [Phycisphaerales bacterium]
MPDWRDISVWRRLAEAPEAQVAAAAVDARDAASIARLRKQFDADLVAAALELAEARRKAAAKFAGAGALWCDVAGVEQASGERVAAWKARRMAEVLGAGAAILDVCCGIGGDAMALARAGLRVTAVDLDERRAWMAGMNAGCPTRAADAESIARAGAALHADPARRDERGGARSWSLDDHRPGRAWIERALREARAVAIKFSPGVDRREFGDLRIEWEFIEERGARGGPARSADGIPARSAHGTPARSAHGTLVQAVAWGGSFARSAGATRATVLSEGEPVTLSGRPDDARADRLEAGGALGAGRFVSEPCAALERAMLLTEAVGGRAAEIVRGVGLVASDAPLAPPWFESFAFVEECAARADVIVGTLARHGLVARSVRVRGRAVDADLLTKSIGARPSGDSIVFAFRRGERATAVIARITGGHGAG